MSRINWDDYFFKIVDDVSLRSTCISRQVGALITRSNQILTTGYNGSPIGSVNCSSINKCKRKQLKVKSGTHAELCKGVHAEQNTIIQAAKYGIQIENSIMYTSCSPCSICLKMIINAGIICIKFKEEYPDELSKTIALESEYLWLNNMIIKKGLIK